jgi:hypothetical protein
MTPIEGNEPGQLGYWVDAYGRVWFTKGPWDWHRYRAANPMTEDGEAE